jgi:branched-subunit amino acid permease
MGKGAIFIGILLVLVSIWGAFKVLTTNTPILVLIYPLVGIGIGIALIVLYKEESKIEQRKDLKSKKSRK